MFVLLKEFLKTILFLCLRTSGMKAFHTAFEYRVFADSGAVIPASGVALSEESASIEAGSSMQLFATVSPPDATYQSVDWYSSDTTLAEVNPIGIVRGISPGTVFVVAQNGDQADTCVLTITGIPVTGIDILKEYDSLTVGSLLMMDYTLEPGDASNKFIHWSSGNPEIATVDASGTVLGKAVGSVYIYVETDDGHKKDSCEITVIPGNEFTEYFSRPDSWASAIKIYYWDPVPAASMSIMDLNGRIVFETSLNAARTTINLSFLNQSLYIISVRGDTFYLHRTILVSY